MNDRTEIRALLSTIVRKGDHYPVPRKLTRQLGIVPANVLMYTLNCGQELTNSHGVMLATPKFVQAGIGLEPLRQEELFEALQRDGLIELDYEEHRRYIAFNCDRIRGIV